MKKQLQTRNQCLQTRLCRLQEKTKCKRKPTKEEALSFISEFASGPAFEFVKCQIMLSGTKTQGHRYSEDFKILPYHSQENIFSSRHKHVEIICKFLNIEPDFHQAVFDGLKTKAEVIMEKSGLCVIVYDEMAIKEHLNYDVSKDVEDLGFMEKTQNVANNDSVFMVRG